MNSPFDLDFEKPLIELSIWVLNPVTIDYDKLEKTNKEEPKNKRGIKFEIYSAKSAFVMQNNVRGSFCIDPIGGEDQLILELN